MFRDSLSSIWLVSSPNSSQIFSPSGLLCWLYSNERVSPRPYPQMGHLGVTAPRGCLLLAQGSLGGKEEMPALQPRAPPPFPGRRILLTEAQESHLEQ